MTRMTHQNTFFRGTQKKWRAWRLWLNRRVFSPQEPFSARTAQMKQRDPDVVAM